MCSRGFLLKSLFMKVVGGPEKDLLFWLSLK